MGCFCISFNAMVTGARVLNLVVVMWHMIQAAVIFALADPLDSANTSDVEYPLVKTVVRWYAVEDQGNVTADVPSVILAVNGSVSVVMQPALSSVQVKLSTVYIIFAFCLLSSFGQFYFAMSDAI